MKNSGDRRPHGAEAVKNIEVSESHIKPRAIFAVIFLIMGIAAIGLCVKNLLNTAPGWQRVEVYLSEPSAADEFTLDLNFGAEGRNPTAESKIVTALYSEACVKAYKLFDSELLFDGVNNVAYINAHPNEEITVDPVLYDAFSKWDRYGGRYLYLAPVYDEYDAAFFGIEMPESAAELDPYENEEFASELNQLAEFAKDSGHISLKLLGDNKVVLYVSDEYAAFAAEYGITSYVDFYRTKNAFIIDYFADILADNGLGAAVISSHDGYTRNLDADGNEYVLSIFDRTGDQICTAGKLKYTSPQAFVMLSDFPMSERDSYRYYMKGGRIITPFIDPEDGLYRTAASSMISYSGSMGCADILLQMLPVYIADEVDTTLLGAASEQGIDSIWCEDFTVYHTDKDGAFFDVFSDGEILYDAEYAGE